jgi:hypothetical protein
MNSKNKKQPTKSERAHIGRVKDTACAICDAPPPVEAHEIKQGDWFTSIGLCVACHRGPLGIHGDKTLWRIRKMEEIDALNVTLSRALA